MICFEELYKSRDGFRTLLSDCKFLLQKSNQDIVKNYETVNALNATVALGQYGL